MKSIKEYSRNVYSQNGEDGILAEAIKRINPKPKVAVEFGGADGFFCSNTALLRREGWNVIMYDINVPMTEQDKLFVICHEITPENINEIPKCSILSIDIDGNDYEVWKAYDGTPDIVVIEINSSLNPDIEYFHPEHGASLITMNILAVAKGYFLLCHTGNCIYVKFKHNHLFPDRDESFNTQWLK